MPTDTDRFPAIWLANWRSVLHDTDHLFQLLQKIAHSQVSVALASEILKIWLNFYIVLFSDTWISDRLFVHMRITCQTMCKNCKKIVFVWEMMMPYKNDLLTGCLVRTRNTKPLLLCTALASSSCTKRSGFVFPSTDRVTPVSKLLLLTGCKGRTVKYKARYFEVRTELARSVRKTRGLSISRYGSSDPVNK